MRRQVAIRSGFTLLLAGLLAACGNSQPGRTSGGAATGAGTGALIGIIGGPIGVVLGAAVGAGAGALTATNTTPGQVDLGDPLWARSHGVNAPAAPAGAPGSLPPPAPLEAAPYTPPSGPPTPGATATPPSPAIQSQSLAPAQAGNGQSSYGQPTALAPAAQ